MNKKTEKFYEMKFDELVAELKEQKERLFRLRFSHATGQLANPLELQSCKRDIARVKTVLKQRELKGETMPKKAAKASVPAAKPAAKAATTKSAKTEKVAK